MNAVTVSEKYQVVIPKHIREVAGLTPGTRLEVLPYDNRIELVPIRPMQDLKGIFPGIDTTIVRDEDR